MLQAEGEEGIGGGGKGMGEGMRVMSEGWDGVLSKGDLNQGERGIRVTCRWRRK